MAERRVINGFIVERGPDGTLTTIGPANGPAPQMPADPVFPYQGPQASATLTKTQLDNQVTQATLPYAVRKAAADAAAAEAAAETARKGPVGAELQKSRAAQVQAARGLHNQLDRVEGIYDDKFRNNGIYSIAEFNPFSAANGQLAAASNVLMPFVKPLARTPGEGATDKSEYQDYRDLLPSGTSFDSTNDERILGLREMANSILRENGLPEYTRPTVPPTPDDAAPQQRDQMSPAGVLPQGPDRSNRADVLFGQPPSDSQNGGFVPYGAETRLERNPQWKGVNEAVKGMIVSGRPAQEIKAFMNSKGIAGDAARGVDDAINYYRKTGKQDFGVDVENIQVPMSGFDQFRNNAPQTMLGTAAATALNAGGFGIPQMLAGGGGLDYLRQQNPGSAFAGDVAGVIGGTAALGKVGGNVAGRLAPSLLGGGGKAAAGRQLATDAAYGGVYGATTEGTPQGALAGALTAGLGSAGGQVIGKGLQKGLQGAFMSAPAEALKGMGVNNLTIGQMLGGKAKSLEDAMTSAPLIGDIVNARRLEGLTDFNQAAFNQAGAPIGATVNDLGEAGIDVLRPQISRAYDNATQGVNVPLDEQFMTGINTARAAGNNLPPDLKARFDSAMTNRVDPLMQGSGTRIYHGTTAGAARNIDANGFDLSKSADGSAWFTSNPNIGEVAASGKGGIIQRYIDENRLKLGGWDETDRFSSDQLVQQGYDGLKFVDEGEPTTYQIFNPEKLTSTSNPSMTGNQYQQAMRGLSGYKAEMPKAGFEADYRDALSGVQQTLKDVMMRQGGEGVVSGLGKADAAYRNSKILGKAVEASRNGTRSGEVGIFTPSQLNDASVMNARKFGGQGATESRPFYDLATTGQQVLPSQLPDSGTARRYVSLALPASLGGVGGGVGFYGGDPQTAMQGAGAGLTVGALLALGGSKAGQKALEAALFKRPKAVRRAGGIFGSRKGQQALSGLVTAPLLIE